MIHVAHILPYMGVGGCENSVLMHCKFCNREKFNYVVIASREGIMASEIRQTGTPVYTEPGSYHEAMRWADIVNLHWGRYHDYWHALVQSSGKPYVTTLRGASVLPKLPAVTICVAYHVYQMQKDESRFVVIPNGVDLSRFAPRPRQRREEVIITRICRPSRCALYFWSAMEKVLDRYPQTRLWIVGNKSDPGRSSKRVRFLGIRRDIPEILAETDIFVYTPYPNVGAKDLVAMEALAMGVPCVVSDVKAVRESVEQGQSGFLTPFGDVHALVQKVGLMVEDASLRARMSKAAVRIAQERFDMRRITRLYEVVYQTVLDAYQSR